MATTPAAQPSMFFVPLYLVGGALLGTGILNLYWSFGQKSGAELNGDLRAVGYDGLDNIALLPSFYLAIGAIIVGLIFLVGANMYAWKQTGGY